LDTCKVIGDDDDDDDDDDNDEGKSFFNFAEIWQTCGLRSINVQNFNLSFLGIEIEKNRFQVGKIGNFRSKSLYCRDHFFDTKFFVEIFHSGISR